MHSDRIRVGAALFHGIPVDPYNLFIHEMFTHVTDVYFEFGVCICKLTI